MSAMARWPSVQAKCSGLAGLLAGWPTALDLRDGRAGGAGGGVVVGGSGRWAYGVAGVVAGPEWEWAASQD